MNQRQFLISIQYLRGLAAVAVIVWHTGWARTVLGQVGVDIFFVISGFIMMLVSGTGVTPIEFGLKRLGRIAPLYWIITLITAYINNSSLLEVTKSLFFWPTGDFPIVLQGWSLNLEVSYYLLFSLLLVFNPFVRLLLLCVIIVTLTVSSTYIYSQTQSIMNWSSPLAIEFLAGVLLFVFWKNYYIPVGIAAWISGAIAITALAKTYSLSSAPEAWTRVLIWGIPSLLIVSAGLGIERSKQLPKISTLLLLGEASYSVYLSHYLLILPLVSLLSNIWAPIGVTIITLLTTLFGIFVYRFIEKPLISFTYFLIKSLQQRFERGNREIR